MQENRICTLCKDGNDRHFLTICDALKHEHLVVKQLLDEKDDKFELYDMMKDCIRR